MSCDAAIVESIAGALIGVVLIIAIAVVLVKVLK